MKTDRIKKQIEMAEVISQEEIAPGIFDLWLRTELALLSKPGQFLGVYTRDKSALLPRPISICLADRSQMALRLVYRVAGLGTAEFSTYKKGEQVKILGCLGNGFPLQIPDRGNVFLIGGGIGIPPILGLAAAMKEEGYPENRKIIVGYRDSEMFLKKDLEQNGEVYIATEDGSFGTRGNVMDAIREKSLQADLIYACGPMPMLRAIKQYAQERQIDAYLSLEEHMACGVGACLGCVVKTKEIDAHSHVKNARICTEGPVFLAEEVDI